MTTTSRRRSTAPATAFATVVLILVLAAPAAASGEPGETGASGATGATVAVVPTVPAGALPGIDVSNHQGAIDWSLVAASGTRFAFAKATEGRTFIDPMYATNKAGAALGGVVFGAYHFARPDDTANDAVIEADHFVDVAQLAPGNLLPVLDIESTGGLTQAQVVASPTVPAANWGGNGWTFWQYGNCGAVPGIDGCVDVDWYETGSFDPVTIPAPDDVPPSATFALPATPGDPVVISFSEIVHQVTPENAFVWIPGTGTYPDVELSCRSGKGAGVDCVSGNVRTALVRPLEPFVLGETYEAVVNPPIAPVLVVDRSANPVPTTALGFATPTEVEDESPAISYAWRTASKARAKGGRYAVEHRAGATASFAFAGGSVTWYTAVGPNRGKAAISIDGDPHGTFDAYAARADFPVPRTFDGLGPGSHTITIRVLGRARASATDTQVVVDAFRAGGELAANPDLRATWGTVGRGGASGGSFGSSDLRRSSAEVRFRGTGIEWFTYRGRDQGRAEVYVDGLLVRTVDNFAPAATFDVARSITGLPDGIHTLRIVVLATARAAATGELVSIDRFSIVP